MSDVKENTFESIVMEIGRWAGIVKDTTDKIIETSPNKPKKNEQSDKSTN